MFSEQTCGCICISPFCPDIMGECAVAGGACADQQLSDSCTKGVDCPWWVNGLKDESCITGTVVRRDFVFLVAGVVKRDSLHVALELERASSLSVIRLCPTAHLNFAICSCVSFRYHSVDVFGMS